MRRFAALFEALDTTTSTNAKVDAMLDYFQGVSASDAAWAMLVAKSETAMTIAKTETAVITD